MLERHRLDLMDILRAYPALDAAEAGHVSRTLSFLERAAGPFSRHTAAGHITASGFLLDPAGRRVALVFHGKLGRWLQPGGHCEPDLDATTLETARRELDEETGFSRDALVPAGSLVGLADGAPLTVDVHEVPADGGFPAHLHYDLVYLFRLADVAPRQSAAVRWTPLAGLTYNPDRSLGRCARKVGQFIR